MIDQLPYTLTKGVTATREGLVVFTGDNTFISMAFGMKYNPSNKSLWPWPYAAERLRYRAGKPFCVLVAEEGSEEVLWGTPAQLPVANVAALHRLAAILCDDADAFRVLHWCVGEFGNPSSRRKMDER